MWLRYPGSVIKLGMRATLHACDIVPQSPQDVLSSTDLLLRPRLSKDAQIFLPGSEGYLNATQRWSNLFHPAFALIVAPRTERDIQSTIQHANALNLPFLAIGGRHGTANALNDARNAVGIWTRSMRAITVHDATFEAEDGSRYGTATVEPGVQAGELTSTLHAHGKTGASTACDCVGVAGALLGGGHGFLQGRHGLLLDNVVSARVVTPDGRRVVTASRAENADLFWGLRGAGHNFGVVASVEYRVFDRRPGTDAWAYAEYVFSHERLEGVYEVANGMVGGPVELTHYGHFERRAEVDAEHVTRPALLGNLARPPSPAKIHGPPCAPWALSTKTGVVDITQLNGIAGANLSSPFCAYGADILLSPTSLRRWNTTALRRAFDIYAAFPPWLRRSAALLEGYASQAVQAVPEADTAYPDRFNNLLVSPVMMYTAPNSDGIAEDGDGDGMQNSDLRAEMKEYADRFRAALVEGSGDDRLYAYVNYATGDEGLEAIYGYDKWRLDKLRRLKQIWDPEGRMDFYNPIS
ncbi:FAD-binding domain-containing protein [Apiospora rasikravindrae]|uniref:FAD-binding domain-containing protein n=1 Tax=Apiospora rasikravindrae TaxID=990691 RepID=A0ABR1RZE9_9PEZI